MAITSKRTQPWTQHQTLHTRWREVVLDMRCNKIPSTSCHDATVYCLGRSLSSRTIGAKHFFSSASDHEVIFLVSQCLAIRAAASCFVDLQIIFKTLLFVDNQCHTQSYMTIFTVRLLFCRYLRRRLECLQHSTHSTYEHWAQDTTHSPCSPVRRVSREDLQSVFSVWSSLPCCEWRPLRLGSLQCETLAPVNCTPTLQHFVSHHNTPAS